MLLEWLSSPPARGGYFLLSCTTTYEYTTGTTCIARRSEGTFSGQSKLFHGTHVASWVFLSLVRFSLLVCVLEKSGEARENSTLLLVVELDFTIIL